MNSAGSSGASADGSTPSWMVRLLARSSLVDDLDLARDAGADVEALDLGGMADADGVDRQLGAVAEGDDVAVGGEALAQPVGQRRGPRSRERSRISVEPSVPAASTTMSAVTRCRAAAPFAPHPGARSGPRQPPVAAPWRRGAPWRG